MRIPAQPRPLCPARPMKAQDRAFDARDIYLACRLVGRRSASLGPAHSSDAGRVQSQPPAGGQEKNPVFS